MENQLGCAAGRILLNRGMDSARKLEKVSRARDGRQLSGRGESGDFRDVADFEKV